MPHWVRPPLSARWSRSGQPPFVGRRPEIAALEQAWASVSTGASAAVFVSGEAGAGKSRLVAEFATSVYEEGAVVLVGTCTAELGGPYEPFDDPIRRLATGVTRGELADPADSLPSGVLAARLGDIVGGDGAPTAALAQRQLYQAVVVAAKAAAARHPLVLVLEDMQWAGATALRLLTYLIERTTDTPVLMLITLRTRTPDRSSALTDTLAGLSRLDTVTRLDLPPLSGDDVMEYIDRDGTLPPPEAAVTAAMLLRESGGNAFYLRELWRDLKSRAPGASRPPESLRDALETVLRRLTPEQHRVLELAAVLGEEASTSELASICDADAGLRADVVDAALEAAEREGMLAVDLSFRFSHGIARQLLLDRIPPGRLATLHGLVAERLESSFPAAPRLIPRLAHHYSSAATPRYHSSAVRYLVAAAELAERSFAHRDAAALLHRAAEVERDTTQKNELQLREARSLTLGGAFDAARAVDERVAESGDIRQGVRAAIGYEVASWRPGLPGHRAVTLLTVAMRGIADDGRDPLYVRALAALGRATAFSGAQAEAAAISDRAVTLARTIGDTTLLASVLRTSIHHTLRPAGLSVQVGRAEELSAMARLSGATEVLGAAAIIRAAAHFIRAERAEFDRAEGELAWVTRELGGGEWSYWHGSVQYGRMFSEGRIEEADRIRRDLQERQDEFGSDRTDGPFGLQSYMVRREAGRLDAVRRLVTGEETPDRSWGPGLVALYTEYGMAAPLRRLVDQQLATLDSADRASAEWPARLVFLVEAVLRLRDIVSARRLRPLVAQYEGSRLMAGHFLAVFGAADRYLGALDSLMGTGAPRDRFEAALVIEERMEARLHLAETLAMYAAHLRRRGTDAAAARSFESRCRAIAEPASLTRVLRMLGPIETGTSQPSGDGLTPREVEVLRLVGEGMSNRRIAQSLVISENTAANHIRSILMKIGAANRTQAAMYASARGLLSTGEVRRS